VAQPKLSVLSLWGGANAYAEGRAYRNPITGDKYPSVTTILKMSNKDGLNQYAADQAVKWCAANWQILAQRSDEDAFKAGRYRWRDATNERAEVGTGVHEYIEAEHTNSWNFPPLDPEQKRIIKQWDWLKTQHEIKPILSEFTVFNKDAGVMGTADGLWEIDGVTTLIDVKTSKNHWPEHDAQLAALWFAETWFDESEDMSWVERPRPEYEACAIIHLREDKAEIIPITDLDLHYAKYKGYVQVYNATQALKERAKAKTKALESITEEDANW
jgi:hypothetical protein